MFNIIKNLFDKNQKSIVKSNLNENQTNNINNQNIQMPITPIIDDSTKREYDKDYRMSSDNINVIRLNQISPKGLPKKVKEFVEIMGLTKDNRQVFGEIFIKGSNRKLELRREPTNLYDNNAVEVYGSCEYKGQTISDKLGYLPKAIAAELSNNDKIGATVKYMTFPCLTRGINIRIDIWTERAKPVKSQDIEKPYKNILVPKNPVDRNIMGIDLEKEGYIDNAIELYELNIKCGFSGTHPYDRLAIIYRRKKQYLEEIRVIKKAIEIYSNPTENWQRENKESLLSKYQKRLDKAKTLYNRIKKNK